LFTIFYAGLLLLVYPPGSLTAAQVPLTAAGSLMTTTGVRTSVSPVFAFARGGETSPSLALSVSGSSNSVTRVEDGRYFRTAAGPLPALVDSNGIVFSANGRTSLVPAFSFRPLPVSLWTRLLHLAVFKTQFTVPIYLCIICICWVISHFQEAGERERRTLELEARLTQANLQALKMQLQPHFLFNTLNAISSLIYENPKAADDMVGSLSQFLRTTLDVSSQNEVSLRQELEFVDSYLEIQQTRFGERLQIRREMDPEVMGALVPPLILQPLVENAIRYGIEPRETGGTVTLRAMRAGEVLRLQISDDGEGFQGGQWLSSRYGIGLSNTKARLQELYGDKHQFKLTANQPAGACVNIEIPFRLIPSNTPDEA
jgi:two-component sensor histidine kinase